MSEVDFDKDAFAAWLAATTGRTGDMVIAPMRGNEKWVGGWTTS